MDFVLDLGQLPLIIAVSFLAGLLGALVGLGGGVLLVPFLVLFEHVPMPYAVGASIVGVVATSSASASAYVRSRLSNIRLGMFLEVGTVIGALLGAALSLSLPVHLLEMLFGLTALLVCASMLRAPDGEGKPGEKEAGKSGAKAAGRNARKENARPAQDAWASRLKLHGQYHLHGRTHRYEVGSSALGMAGSVLAGLLSGLFGIGGGVIKVPLMTLGMGVPLRAAAATSNFMIGVTAATGAAVFWSRGFVVPELAAAVALGVSAGAILGSAWSHQADVRHLRLLFVLVLFYTAVRMLLQGGSALGF